MFDRGLSFGSFMNAGGRFGFNKIDTDTNSQLIVVGLLVVENERFQCKFTIANRRPKPATRRQTKVSDSNTVVDPIFCYVYFE